MPCHPDVFTRELIEELSPGLLRVARRAVRHDDDARDLVQETWMSAFQCVASFEGRSSFRSWITAILRRRIAGHLRRVRLTQELDEQKVSGLDCDVERRLDLSAAAAGTRCAFEQLTPLERAAITRCALDDLDRDDAAASIGISREHLRVVLHRGRSKLKLSVPARALC